MLCLRGNIILFIFCNFCNFGMLLVASFPCITETGQLPQFFIKNYIVKWSRCCNKFSALPLWNHYYGRNVIMPKNSYTTFWFFENKTWTLMGNCGAATFHYEQNDYFSVLYYGIHYLCGRYTQQLYTNFFYFKLFTLSYAKFTVCGRTKLVSVYDKKKVILPLRCICFASNRIKKTPCIYIC